MKTPAKCHRCGHAKMIEKLHCYICEKCRIITSWKGYGRGIEMIDPKEFNFVSQNAHFAAGLAWVFGSICLFGPSLMWYFVAFGVVITAWKEFWYDARYESAEVRGSSLEDFSFYCMGLFGAAGAYLIRGLIH